MKDHPLPQNISSYQFHLIGTMTLKQFFFLSGGLAMAWIFYSLPIIVIFKWPLVIVSAFTGIGFAFIPYQDRPLDQWFTAFIKAIYSPTQFLWKKTSRLPEFLAPRSKTKTPALPETKVSQHNGQAPLKKYLQSLTTDEDQTELTTQEIQKLTKIDELFKTAPNAAGQAKELPIENSQIQNVKISIRKLKLAPPDFNKLASQSSSPLLKTNLSQVVKTSPPSSSSTQPLTTPTTKATTTKAAGAIINTQLPFPSTPEEPNRLVGMTLDPKRNILENTIIEIRNAKGQPVRALKSNKLGQFFIGTPLPNDNYQIEAEKEGYTFKTISMTLTGKIIPPIEIKALSQIKSTTNSVPLTTPSSRPQPAVQ